MLRAEQLRELPALVCCDELLEATNQLVVNKDLGEGHHPGLFVQSDPSVGIHAEVDLFEWNLARVE